MKQGFVYGASDRQGAQPLENPVSPGDIVATIYRLLGLDPRSVIHDPLGRPHTIVPEGRVVQEIIA